MKSDKFTALKSQVPANILWTRPNIFFNKVESQKKERYFKWIKIE